jgi:nitroimidazol reductase NimA-like FMN-containing flavoprotein (pyridoxamine 5'-phosphate oxidase superfamily)
MLRELNDHQIETLLKDQFIGRIGCHLAGVTYIVPVNYVYDGIVPNCLIEMIKGLK